MLCQLSAHIANSSTACPFQPTAALPGWPHECAVQLELSWVHTRQHPPWLDTMMPSTPYCRASRASSGDSTPCNTPTRTQCLYPHGYRQQRTALVAPAPCGGLACWPAQLIFQLSLECEGCDTGGHPANNQLPSQAAQPSLTLTKMGTLVRVRSQGMNCQVRLSSTSLANSWNRPEPWSLSRACDSCPLPCCRCCFSASGSRLTMLRWSGSLNLLHS